MSGRAGRAAAWWRTGLLLGLLLGHSVGQLAEQQPQQQEQQDRPQEQQEQQQDRAAQRTQSDDQEQQQQEQQRGAAGQHGDQAEHADQLQTGDHALHADQAQAGDTTQQTQHVDQAVGQHVDQAVGQHVDQAQHVNRGQHGDPTLGLHVGQAQHVDRGQHVDQAQHGDGEQSSDQAQVQQSDPSQHSDSVALGQSTLPSAERADRHGDQGKQSQESTYGQPTDRPVRSDKSGRPDKPEHPGQRGQGSQRGIPDSRCAAGDDAGRDCPPDMYTSTEGSERRLNVNPHGKPLVPDEDGPDLGFLYSRSLSLSADEESNMTSMSVRGRSLRNRVFGQTWCSAVACPVSAALTLANTTSKHSSRKIGQGEAVVACVNCSFSATSVSIVDGDAVCASASSTSMPRGVCVALCQWEGTDCACSAGCSSNEMGSDSVHSYGYQVTAATSVPDQLAYLHRLMVRIHNTAEHLNIAAMLDVPGKTRQVRANVERRYGREKAKLVPVILPGTGSLQ